MFRSKVMALLLGITLALGALGGVAQATEAEDTGPGEVIVHVECELVTVTNNSQEEVQVGQKVIEAAVNIVVPGDTFVMPGQEGVDWYVYSDNHGYLQEGVFTECEPKPTPEPDEGETPDEDEGEAPGVIVDDDTEADVGDGEDATEEDDETETDEPAECEAVVENGPVVDADAATLPFTGIEPWMIYAAATLTLSGIVALMFGKKTERYENV